MLTNLENTTSLAEVIKYQNQFSRKCFIPYVHSTSRCLHYPQVYRRWSGLCVSMFCLSQLMRTDEERTAETWWAHFPPSPHPQIWVFFKLIVFSLSADSSNITFANLPLEQWLYTTMHDASPLPPAIQTRQNILHCCIWSQSLYRRCHGMELRLRGPADPHARVNLSWNWMLFL